MPPGDATALAGAIGEMAVSAETREKMGQAGRAKVRAEFDINGEAVWLKALFEGTAGNTLRPPQRSEPG